MDGKGGTTDNAFIERFYRKIKHEYIHFHPKKEVIELYKGLDKYVEYHN